MKKIAYDTAILSIDTDLVNESNKLESHLWIIQQIFNSLHGNGVQFTYVEEENK